MHPVHERLTEPGGLAERLLGLRKAAGLTGDDLGARLSWARSKVSKIENGRQVPSPDDIRAWAGVCRQPEAIDDLLERLADVQSVHTRWRNRVRHGGQASVQQDIDHMTQTARRIRNAEVAVIPGLLQTAGYARSIATQSALIHENTDIDAAVAARMRRQEILYDSTKRFEFVITEAALRMLSCPRTVMLGQLDRLMSMDLENVTLGIIPMGRELQMTLYNGFLMLDDVLITESYGYEDQGTDQSDAHGRIFEMLMDESATAQDARRLIASAASSLRQLGIEMYQQPEYVATAVIHDRKHRDWRLIGAYIIGGVGMAFGIACLVLLLAAKNVVTVQMTQMRHSIVHEQTERSNSYQNLNDRISGIANVVGPMAAFNLTCSQYLTGPNGGPTTFYFACSSARPGNG